MSEVDNEESSEEGEWEVFRADEVMSKAVDGSTAIEESFMEKVPTMQEAQQLVDLLNDDDLSRAIEGCPPQVLEYVEKSLDFLKRLVGTAVADEPETLENHLTGILGPMTEEGLLRKYYTTLLRHCNLKQRGKRIQGFVRTHAQNVVVHKIKEKLQEMARAKDEAVRRLNLLQNKYTEMRLKIVYARENLLIDQAETDGRVLRDLARELARKAELENPTAPPDNICKGCLMSMGHRLDATAHLSRPQARLREGWSQMSVERRREIVLTSMIIHTRGLLEAQKETNLLQALQIQSLEAALNSTRMSHTAQLMAYRPPRSPHEAQQEAALRIDPALVVQVTQMMCKTLRETLKQLSFSVKTALMSFTQFTARSDYDLKLLFLKWTSSAENPLAFVKAFDTWYTPLMQSIASVPNVCDTMRVPDDVVGKTLETECTDDMSFRVVDHLADRLEVVSYYTQRAYLAYSELRRKFDEAMQNHEAEMEKLQAKAAICLGNSASTSTAVVQTAPCIPVFRLTSSATCTPQRETTSVQTETTHYSHRAWVHFSDKPTQTLVRCFDDVETQTTDLVPCESVMCGLDKVDCSMQTDDVPFPKHITGSTTTTTTFCLSNSIRGDPSMAYTVCYICHDCSADEEPPEIPETLGYSSRVIEVLRQAMHCEFQRIDTMRRLLKEYQLLHDRILCSQLSSPPYHTAVDHSGEPAPLPPEVLDHLSHCQQFDEATALAYLPPAMPSTPHSLPETPHPEAPPPALPPLPPATVLPPTPPRGLQIRRTVRPKGPHRNVPACKDKVHKVNMLPSLPALPSKPGVVLRSPYL